ncbi:MAG: 2-dehydropantoate 2-reductase [Vicinamibacterales bacterium]
MRIAIMGSGGVGGYFGGRLAAAGEDVHFIARGRHLEALRASGLRLASPKGDLHLPTVQATADPAAIGPVDVVLFTVKLYDVDASAEAVRPLIGPETVVITMQNGVEAVDMVAAKVGRDHVAGGVCYISAVIDEPGVIRHTAMDTMVFGETDGRVTPRLQAFEAAGRRAGFEATVTADIDPVIWTKFVRLSGWSGMTAATRSPIGVLRDDPRIFAVLREAFEEAVAVGRARGVALPAAILEETLALVQTFPAGTKSSLLEDLERGRRLELPWLSGAGVRLGREAGVPTPTHRFIEAVLTPHAAGAPA